MAIARLVEMKLIELNAIERTRRHQRTLPLVTIKEKKHFVLVNVLKLVFITIGALRVPVNGIVAVVSMANLLVENCVIRIAKLMINHTIHAQQILIAHFIMSMFVLPLKLISRQIYIW